MATRLTFTLICLVILLPACAAIAPPPPELCGVTAADFLADFDPLVERFYDAGTVADNTARVALDGPVSDLQAIRRELEALDDGNLPDCAQRVYDPALDYMNHVIEALLMFMRDEPEEAVTAKIMRAAELRREFTAATNLIRQEILQATRTAEE